MVNDTSEDTLLCVTGIATVVIVKTVVCPASKAGSVLAVVDFVLTDR